MRPDAVLAVGTALDVKTQRLVNICTDDEMNQLLSRAVQLDMDMDRFILSRTTQEHAPVLRADKSYQHRTKFDQLQQRNDALKGLRR